MATVLAFAFVITVLVVVHELGHFLAARWFGVPVEVFSVGFGPSVWSVRRAGVEYRLSAIPFGGYVKMAGSTSAVETTPRGFDSKTRWQRFVILLAGPAMNILFALGLAIVGLWVGIEVRSASGQMVIYRPEPVEAILLGGQAIAASSARILLTLGALLTGEVSVSHLIGPVGLAQIAGESSALGWRARKRARWCGAVAGAASPSKVSRAPSSGSASPAVPSNNNDTRGSAAMFRVCSASAESRSSGAPS